MGFKLALNWADLKAFDLVMVIISFMGLSGIIIQSHNLILVGLIGSLILIIMGSSMMIRKNNIVIPEKGQIKSNKLLCFLKGFFLNSVIPSNLIFWAGITSLAIKKFGIENNNIFSFLSGLLLVAIISGILKCYLSKPIILLLNSNKLIKIDKINGLLIVISGIVVLIRVIF